jgi:hypothetical protein
MGLFTRDIKTMAELFLHTLQDIYYTENQKQAKHRVPSKAEYRPRDSEIIVHQPRKPAHLVEPLLMAHAARDVAQELPGGFVDDEMWSAMDLTGAAHVETANLILLAERGRDHPVPLGRVHIGQLVRGTS